MESREEQKEKQSDKTARVNFRPLLFCALGLVGGIFLYGRLRFGGWTAADLFFPALFLLLALRPFSLKRLCLILCILAVSMGLGAGLIHRSTQSFLDCREAGRYTLTGTVCDVSVYGGYSSAVLTGLSFDGERVDGKCEALLDEGARTGDIYRITAEITLTEPIGAGSDFSAGNRFAADVRYRAHATEYERTGRSADPFLKLNAAIYDTFRTNMAGDAADTAYALLTGNSGAMGAELKTAVRRGGIAHIFAVSGLHIGILYTAVFLLSKPLKRLRFLPALLVALGYGALCGFSVSCIRAVIMCGVLGFNRSLGRKHDLLSSLSFAGILILLLFPAEWYSAGFRLSFGACMGLALFASPLTRALGRIRIPRLLAGCLAANLSVQLFLFPVMYEIFGYFPVWSVLLNLLIVPLLPVLFLSLLLTTALALVLPFAAGYVLLLPQNMISLFILFVTNLDATAVVAGFSLGAGGAVWLTASVLLSSRIRAGRPLRFSLAAVLALLFCFAVTFENVVFTGTRILCYSENGANAALVQTRRESVLILDENFSSAACSRFLNERFGGTLTAIVVLSENGTDLPEAAVGANAREIRMKEETETGLKNTAVKFGDAFSYGSLSFAYADTGRLILYTENVLTEFAFRGKGALSSDLFVSGGAQGLKYYLKDGIIRTR